MNITIEQLRFWINAEYEELETEIKRHRAYGILELVDYYATQQTALINLAGRIEAQTGKAIFQDGER